MSEHDQTNRGVFFKPHPDQTMIGQGRINANGADQRIIVVREKMSREGNPVRSVYMRVGVLFDNDKKGNDKAPDYSGPLDVPAGWRMSGWLGKTDAGQNYCSLQVQPPFDKDGGGNGGGGNSGGGTVKPNQGLDDAFDDDIPF